MEYSGFTRRDFHKNIHISALFVVSGVSSYCVLFIDGAILVFAKKKKKKKKLVYSRSYGPIAAAAHNLDRLSENLSRALTTICTFMQQQTQGDVLKHEPQTCRVKHPLRLLHP